ncbi:hypothetical protein BFJ63_vAg18944 [Fusarium oxysporum f. sp. narcissi]|uniref:PD-(D/E)XK nuclease-like domain-containing protein n=1 Tax=Fusarium oxysporum f. sp. narcissi TaxID=451672 RepID=A0A4Q2UVY0_FUSOX|nr:hypothetical protein BFJ63_vAg18944 [Fusarium oxysporum f. sp. narcissi]
MSSAAITAWLRDLPNEFSRDIKNGPPAKRQRRHPVTPDPSEDCAFAPMPPRAKSPAKRSAAATNDTQTLDENDNEQTPKPAKRARSLRSDSTLSSSHLSERSSQASGQSSPRKQLQSLKLSPRGVNFQDISLFRHKPADLKELLKRISFVMECNGILSTSRKEELVKASESSDDFEWVNWNDNYFSDKREALGHTPSPEDVSQVLDAAAECNTNSHPEANWNLEVHQLVLSLAFRPPGQRILKHFVNFMGSTQAGLIPEYTHSPFAQKVDFSIYIEPGNDSDPSESDSPDAIERCLRDLPDYAFNFTDFVPLERRPIALSVESKKPSEGFDRANIQLGVWLSAHWTFLRHLREISSDKVMASAKQKTATQQEAAIQPPLTAEEDAMVTSQDETNLELSSAKDNVFNLPSFLPGIIIQGHSWYLVVTTMGGQRTNFWHKVDIGNTQSTKGIYQIVCVLHLLRSWVEKTYWPLIYNMVTKGWPKE